MCAMQNIFYQIFNLSTMSMYMILIIIYIYAIYIYLIKTVFTKKYFVLLLNKNTVNKKLFLPITNVTLSDFFFTHVVEYKSFQLILVI